LHALFILPTFTSDNFRIQKTIYGNFYQEYTFTSAICKYYGFLDMLKFVIFGFLLVFVQSEPLVPVIVFVVFCLITLGITLRYKIFTSKWGQAQSIITDILMISFCAIVIALIFYDEQTIECQEDRVYLAFGLICIDYAFFIIFAINIVISCIEWYKKISKYCRKSQGQREEHQAPSP